MRAVLLCLACLSSLGAAPVAVPSTPVVRHEESFDNRTGKPRNIDVESYAWDSYVGEGGVVSRSGTSIGAGPGHPSASPGYLSFTSASNVSRILTKTLPSRIRLGEGAEAEFRFGASNERVEARFLVRVGEEWFATDAVFTGAVRIQNGAAFSSASEAEVLRRVSLDPSRRSWRRVRLESGSVSVVELGGPALALPGKPLAGVGFQVVNLHPGWGATVCFDTIRISAP